MSIFGCLTNPVGCAVDAAHGYLASVSPEWLLGCAFVAGLLIGAWLGKWAVAALIAFAAAALFWRRGSPPPAAPPPPQTRRARRTPPSWIETGK